jgi:hypothetical protein
MIQRCTNPRNHRFKDYGARGIIVCEKWRSSFKEFLGDMGPRPVGKTLDRFPDVNGNYDPGNCRWASRTEQDLNKRNTRRLVFGGKSLTAKEWAGIRGIKEEIIYNRVFGLNWTVRRALTEQPTGGRGRNPASYRPKRYQDVRAIRLREGYKPTK